MKTIWTLSVLIFLLFIIITPVMAGSEIHVLVLGQYRGYFETVMVTTYQTSSHHNQIISIPPGSVFLDGPILLKSQRIVGALESAGIKSVQGALADYLKIPIPYYIIVDYEGAEAVVDAMGGVYFNLPYAIQLPGQDGVPPLHLKAGLQRFDGNTARRFLRYRTGDLYGPGELKVVELQQRFLDAMIRQLAQDKGKIVSVALKLPQMIKTNIGLFDLLNLAYDAVTLDPKDLRVEFGVIPGNFVKVNGQFQYQIKGVKGYRLPIK